MSQSEPRPFILNAFEMTTVSHTNFGLWRHPEDRTSEYTTLPFWTDLARLLDEGGFDALFVADGVGQLDVYGGSAAAALAGGVQAPINDPLLAVSAMAAVTEHLGFGLTVSTTYEYPYLLARKFTTLDHLTEGRVAWNVVTSTRDSAARNILGRDSQIPHDTRYEIAEEFIDVAYKLWEGSWEDDAVVRDDERRVYTDPAKVHPIAHRGKHFTVPGPHLSEPSPQRTPVLFQAGTSEAGKTFAAQHAEVVFLHAPTTEVMRRQTDDIRARAVAEGRSRDAVKFITSVLVITGPTDAAAQRHYEELSRYHSAEGSLVLLSGVTGVDWSTADLDAPLEYVETEGGRSALASTRSSTRRGAGRCATSTARSGATKRSSGARRRSPTASRRSPTRADRRLQPVLRAHARYVRGLHRIRRTRVAPPRAHPRAPARPDAPPAPVRRRVPLPARRASRSPLPPRGPDVAVDRAAARGGDDGSLSGPTSLPTRPIEAGASGIERLNRGYTWLNLC